MFCSSRVARLAIVACATITVPALSQPQLERQGLHGSIVSPGGLFQSPRSHCWWEAQNTSHRYCIVDISKAGITFEEKNLDGVFPEWVPVDPPQRFQVLEGRVNADEPPHISFEDWPTSHYTHDMCFKVEPDSQYNYLRGCECSDPCASERQRLHGLIDDRDKTIGATGKYLGPGNIPDYLKAAREWDALHGSEVDELLKSIRSCPAPRPLATDKRQPLIEVEWECGLGTGKPEGRNLLWSYYTKTAVDARLHNEAGVSAGFFSEGHRNRQPIWNWPTIDDWVHVEGRWVWDRGHEPYQTEIHPPHFLAIRRALPSVADPCVGVREELRGLQDTESRLGNAITRAPRGSSEKENAQAALSHWSQEHSARMAELRQRLADVACAPRLATRIDLFATGDGGALWNNRRSSDRPPYVEPTPMSANDYTFVVAHLVRPPSANCRLQWHWIMRAGDSFPAELDVKEVARFDNGRRTADGATKYADVQVSVPWHSRAAGRDDLLLARTLVLYWDDGSPLVQNGQGVRAYAIRLIQLRVLKSHDSADGDYRVFAEVGGTWTQLNEMAGTEDILDDHLGSTGDGDDYPDDPMNQDVDRSRRDSTACQVWASNGELSQLGEPWSIGTEQVVLVAPGGRFRVHACGWEADGVEDCFGVLADPRQVCDDAFMEFLNSTVFTVMETAASGCANDPIGEVNDIWSSAGRRTDGQCAPGEVWACSVGAPEGGAFCSGTIPNGSYALKYSIRELDLPTALGRIASSEWGVGAQAPAGSTVGAWGTVIQGEVLVDYKTLIAQKAAQLKLGAPMPKTPQPVRTPKPRDEGFYQIFEKGSVYWAPKTGAHMVWGLIRDKWGQQGWEQGKLGFPTSDELTCTAPSSQDKYSTFEGGTIYWKSGSPEATIYYAPTPVGKNGDCRPPFGLGRQ
jgi:hypothetical protein